MRIYNLYAGENKYLPMVVINYEMSIDFHHPVIVVLAAGITAQC